MTIEMEALADKICREELKQEPSDENLAFRKTLVHGMVRWDEESKVKNLSSNPVLSDEICSHPIHDRRKTHRGYHCDKCGHRF